MAKEGSFINLPDQEEEPDTYQSRVFNTLGKAKNAVSNRVFKKAATP